MAASDGITPSAFTLRPLSNQDVEGVVNLHLAALGYSLNSQMGVRHLARLYAFMQQEPTSLVMVAHVNHAPVGVVSSTLNPGKLKSGLLARLALKDKLDLGRCLLFPPSMFWGGLADLGLHRPVVFKGGLVEPCLTALAVAPDTRRIGVGRALVDAVERFVYRRGHTTYYLDTRADNLVSRLFYRRLGFMEVERRGRNVILVKQIAAEAHAS